MKIFLAGGTGAVGRLLIPELTQAGHWVAATTRSKSKLNHLRVLGAHPLVLDLMRPEDVMEAVVAVSPDVVVHEATDLARFRDFKHFDREFFSTNQLRKEGTANLLAARFIAQSYTGWPNERSGSLLKTENDPFDSSPPAAMLQTLEAIQVMEQFVTSNKNMGCAILRYGTFYGPGTSVAPQGRIWESIRHRQIPLIGEGTGVWSWIHVKDAACATKLAIESDVTGVFNVVDDEPAQVAAWLPHLSQSLGAKPPVKIPEWVGRLLVGEAGTSVMTAIRGSSNAKVKHSLSWKPSFSSWREGFAALL